MLILKGSRVFSPSAQSRLLQDLKSVHSKVEGMDCYYVHFVNLSSELTDEEHKTLEKLLTYGPRSGSKEDM